MAAPRLALAAALLLSAAAVPLRADSEAPPRDWSRVAPGGAFLFVMLARGSFIDEDPRLRARYQRSGLYRNDGSTTPVWTVDWYSGDADLTTDGHHVAQHGPWASSGDDLAVAFHAGGVELTRYRIRDLVRDLDRLPRSVSHFGWCRTWDFDQAARRLTIITLNAERYVFDVTTGVILVRDLPGIEEATKNGWTLSACLATLAAPTSGGRTEEALDALLEMTQETSFLGRRTPFGDQPDRAFTADDAQIVEHFAELKRRHEPWFAQLRDRAPPVLERLVPHHDSAVARSASLALAFLGHATAESVKVLAQPQDPQERWANERLRDALIALGELPPGPPPESLPEVLSLLGHREPAVVQATIQVAAGVVRKPGARVQEMILGLSSAGVNQRRLRASILEKAAPLDEPVLRVLIPLASDPDWQVCFHAVWAIALSGPAALAVVPDLEALRDSRPGMAGRKMNDLLARALARIRGGTGS